jgi:hypothetical protein
MEEKKNSQPQANGIATVIIFFILLFVFAKWGPAINFNTTNQTKGEPFVVSGDGKVYVTPDIAKVTLGIEETGNSLKSVQNSVNIKSKALTDAIKKLGIDEKDIKTTSYNVYPQRDYVSSTQNITGYRVSTNYEVTIRDFDKVNETMVAGTSAGANIVGTVSFDLSDSLKTEKTNEAIVKAVAEAKSKAEGLSKAAGISLGKIVNISEGLNQNVRPVAYALEKSDLAIGGGTPIAQPDIQPGTTEIDITISLSYSTR